MANVDASGHRGAGGEFAEQATRWRPPMVETQNWTTPQATEAESAERPSREATGRTTEYLGRQVQNWATPNVPNGGRLNSSEEVESRGSTERGKRQVSLEALARNWATPSARDWRSGEASQETMDRNARPLNEQVSHYSRPAPDWVSLACSMTSLNFSEATLKALGESLKRSAPTRSAGSKSSGGGPGSPPRSARKRLNIYFVEALMGWPPGWTSITGFTV